MPLFQKGERVKFECTTKTKELGSGRTAEFNTVVCDTMSRDMASVSQLAMSPLGHTATVPANEVTDAAMRQQALEFALKVWMAAGPPTKAVSPLDGWSQIAEIAQNYSSFVAAQQHQQSQQQPAIGVEHTAAM